MDAAFAITTILGFASFVTLHIVLSVLLFTHDPRWRGAVALFIPPLAPVWGFQVGRKKISIAWLIALVVYAVGRVLAG